MIAPDTLDSIRARADVDGVEVLIGLAGVQTGQYPRARDLALQCLQRGLPVVIGGFHVSSDAPSRDFLAAQGVTVVIGEAETTWPQLLDDHLRGARRPLYRVADGIRARTGLADISVPTITGAPAGAGCPLSQPLLQSDAEHARHRAGLSIRLLVLRGEERHGPDDARPRSGAGRRVGARRA